MITGYEYYKHWQQCSLEHDLHVCVTAKAVFWPTLTKQCHIHTLIIKYVTKSPKGLSDLSGYR